MLADVLFMWCHHLLVNEVATLDPDRHQRAMMLWAIIDDPPPPKETLLKNRRHIDLASDIKLAELFKEAKRKLMASDDGQVHVWSLN